jgi:iron complex outermembrane receptor protein
MDLPWNLELDIGLRYSDTIPDASAPSYLLMDARIAWHPRENLEIAIVGQNIFDDKHPEHPGGVSLTMPSETEHAVFGKITWTFD